jgi:hypothetical protein
LTHEAKQSGIERSLLNVSFRSGCVGCLFERGSGAEGSQVPV